MAHKGETFTQIPTLWHLGWGYPCRVMRRRRSKDAKTGKWRWRWRNFDHGVLTMATVRRWRRLEHQGKAQIRRDVNLQMWMEAGIVPIPRRALWAGYILNIIYRDAEAGFLVTAETTTQSVIEEARQRWAIAQNGESLVLVTGDEAEIASDRPSLAVARRAETVTLRTKANCST